MNETVITGEYDAMMRSPDDVGVGIASTTPGDATQPPPVTASATTKTASEAIDEYNRQLQQFINIDPEHASRVIREKLEKILAEPDPPVVKLIQATFPGMFSAAKPKKPIEFVRETVYRSEFENPPGCTLPPISVEVLAVSKRDTPPEWARKTYECWVTTYHESDALHGNDENAAITRTSWVLHEGREVLKKEVSVHYYPVEEKPTPSLCDCTEDSTYEVCALAHDRKFLASKYDMTNRWNCAALRFVTKHKGWRYGFPIYVKDYLDEEMRELLVDCRACAVAEHADPDNAKYEGRKASRYMEEELKMDEAFIYLVLNVLQDIGVYVHGGNLCGGWATDDAMSVEI